MYYLGVDFGSQQDYTAIALVRRNEVIDANQNAAGIITQERVKTEYQLLYLERMELGTPYTQIVAHIKHIISDNELSGSITTVADATGVGLPVIQMMREALIYPLVAIGIHGGNQINEKQGGYSVPKRDLVTALLTVVQSRRLRVAGNIRHRQQLIHEMQSFKMKQTKSGNDSYEALMEKDHDDLVLALAYAIWYPERTLGTGAFDMSPTPPSNYDALSQHYT